MEAREMFYKNRDGRDGQPAKNIEVSGAYEIIAEFFGNRDTQLREAQLLLAAPNLLEALGEIAEYCTRQAAF